MGECSSALKQNGSFAVVDFFFLRNSPQFYAVNSRRLEEETEKLLRFIKIIS